MARNTNKPKAPRTRPNYFYAVISVALVLFLLGFFGLIVLHGQQFIQFAKEQVEIIIELKKDANGSQIGYLKDQLQNSYYAKPGTVKFIGKEEGAKLLAEELGDEFMKLDLANPLYDVITFNVKSNFMTPFELNKIRESLKVYEYISDVFYQESLVESIAKNIRKISWLTLGIGIFFIFVAITLIHNTIRLALYSNRFLIKNMELVGASWEFISYPYIGRSIKLGLVSALVAILGLTGLGFWATTALPEISNVIYVPGIIVIFTILVLLGILINAGSTYYVVNKYLRMRVNDLY
jgi:cell division transport system permease protein